MTGSGRRCPSGHGDGLGLVRENGSRKRKGKNDGFDSGACYRRRSSGIHFQEFLQDRVRKERRVRLRPRLRELRKRRTEGLPRGPEDHLLTPWRRPGSRGLRRRLKDFSLYRFRLRLLFSIWVIMSVKMK